MANDNLTVGAWCEQCLSTVMPAQRSGNNSKYSEEALTRYREVVTRIILPSLGSVPVTKLDKATVTELADSLHAGDDRSQMLNVLTRIMTLAELKGKRRKGTSPCKGIPLNKNAKPGGRFADQSRPPEWREQDS